MLKRDDVLSVRASAVYGACGALAAVLEEPDVVLTEERLRGICHAHGRLHDALGVEREYRMRGPVCVMVNGGAIVKVADELPIGKLHPRPIDDFIILDEDVRELAP